jgi:hypothetical protein
MIELTCISALHCDGCHAAYPYCRSGTSLDVAPRLRLLAAADGWSRLVHEQPVGALDLCPSCSRRARKNRPPRKPGDTVEGGPTTPA